MDKKNFEKALEILKARLANVATERRVLRISENFAKGNPHKTVFFAIFPENWEAGYDEISEFVDFADFYFIDKESSYHRNAIYCFMAGLSNVDEEGNNIADLFVEFYENLLPGELPMSSDNDIFEFLLVSGMKEIARISSIDGKPASSLLLIICVLFNLCVQAESASQEH